MSVKRKTIQRTKSEVPLTVFNEENNPGIRFQIDRIKAVLQEAICQLKLIEALPFLLSKKGRQVMKDILDKDSYCGIVASIQNITSKQNIEEYDVALFLRHLCSNRRLLEHLPKVEHYSKDPTIAKVIKFVKKLFDEKMNLTGIEGFRRRKNLLQTYRDNNRHKMFIHEYRSNLHRQDKELGGILNVQVMKLNDYKTQIESMRNHFRKDMENYTYNADRNMNNFVCKIEEHIEELTIESEEVQVSFNNILERHIKDEKIIRMKKSKAESQLTSLIAKFDQDIGEKNKEYEEWKVIYDELSDEIVQIQIKDQEQKSEYEEMMEGKALEEERIENELIMQFLLNRSARRIQSCWREYVALKHAKKKRKGKGKAQSSDKKTT